MSNISRQAPDLVQERERSTSLRAAREGVKRRVEHVVAKPPSDASVDATVDTTFVQTAFSNVPLSGRGKNRISSKSPVPRGTQVGEPAMPGQNNKNTMDTPGRTFGQTTLTPTRQKNLSQGLSQAGLAPVADVSVSRNKQEADGSNPLLSHDGTARVTVTKDVTVSRPGQRRRSRGPENLGDRGSPGVGAPRDPRWRTLRRSKGTQARKTC